MQSTAFLMNLKNCGRNFLARCQEAINLGNILTNKLWLLIDEFRQKKTLCFSKFRFFLAVKREMCWENRGLFFVNFELSMTFSSIN